MNKYGGYFELEVGSGTEYHRNCLRLNSGRNALEYILLSSKYSKVYIPYYTCDVLLTPLIRTGVGYEHYSINRCLQPVFDISSLKPDEAIVVTNYFGLLDSYIESLTGKQANIIVDNAQAFYTKPVDGMDCFYSPRKFFGVPDGAYLYPKTGDFQNELYEKLGQDESWHRCLHLLKRLDGEVELGYLDFKQLSPLFQELPLQKMSKLTTKLLDSIDYSQVKARRRQNYERAHSALEKHNKLSLPLIDDCVPMVYPLLTADRELRTKLVSKGIFIPQYWSNVKQWALPRSLEYDLAEKLVAVPIDQRYNGNQMSKLLDSIIESMS
ncbi:MAG TPA: hypothetical protein PLM19_01750 [Candidatus Syntrophosphaera sp.]|nr:hypothetical protein [Candidatus Cloacimonadota bacterium]HOR02712.1 hypothetical protein [Candidatus Syntrophosphaera sp.]